MGIEMKITFVSYNFFFSTNYILCIYTVLTSLFFIPRTVCLVQPFFILFPLIFLEFRCDGNSQNYTVDHLHAELHAGSRKCPELNLRNLDWFPVKK